MIIETLFPDIQYTKKEKKVRAPREKASSKWNKEDYKPPVFIGQNLYIKPSYIVSIPEFHSDNKGRSLDQLANEANLLENDRKGKLSRKAIQGLRNSINWLCLAAKKKHVYDKKANRTFNFKVNFVTLTLPDTTNPITSKDLQKQLLNPFLTYMRKYHNLKNYVWRLEFQANGKLHVHLTTDTFLHLVTIKETWNRLLDKYGYLDEFYKKHGHKSPNSTDVHATKKIKNIAAYLAKYMSKKNSTYKITKKRSKPRLIGLNFKAAYVQRLNFWNSPFNPRPIEGRIWSCNYELSKANKLTVHVPANECHADLKCLFNPLIEYKELFTEKPKELNPRYSAEHASNNPRKIGEVYFIKAKDWIDKITGVIRKTFDDSISSLQSLSTITSFELDYG